MKKTNSRLKRSAAAAGLAALLAAFPQAGALAAQEPEEAPGQGYEQYQQQLQDDRVEYEELFDLIKNYYAPISNSYASMDETKANTQAIAMESRIMADDLKEQQDELQDMIDELPQTNPQLEASVDTLKATVRQLRSAANSVDDQADHMDSYYRQIDRGTNGVVQAAEMMMNQLEQLSSQRELAAKAVDLSQTAQNVQQTMQAQGMAVDADVLSAAASLSSARQQLASLDAAIEQIQDSLMVFTGYSVTGQKPQFGSVPEPDIESISSIDVEADKEKAVNNNYDLISLRGQAGGGMDTIEQYTTKTTTQTRNKLRAVNYSEDTVRSNIQTLYETILESKAQYDSADTALQSAQMAWDAAQIQRGNGSLSDLGYQQAELTYLQAKSGYDCAKLNLQQAMRNYDWSVRGLTISTQ